jgi:hypothetical protein
MASMKTVATTRVGASRSSAGDSAGTEGNRRSIGARDRLRSAKEGGGDGTRTHDFLLAKQVL